MGGGEDAAVREHEGVANDMGGDEMNNYDIGFEAGMQKAASVFQTGTNLMGTGLSALKKAKPVASAAMTGRDAMNSARDAATRVRGSAATPRPPQASYSPTSSLASRAGMSR